MNNLDTGLVRQVYDKNANLIRRIEPNHAANGTEIKYFYDKNRLSCVDYPQKQDVSYQYGAAPTTTTTPTLAAQAGRVVSVADETGTQNFTYNFLGEIKTVSRDLSDYNLPGGTTLVLVRRKHDRDETVDVKREGRVHAALRFASLGCLALLYGFLVYLSEALWFVAFGLDPEAHPDFRPMG
jgi:hypothetical protein